MRALRKRRERLGLSQRELAERSGVSIRVIQNYEQGRRDIRRGEAWRVWRLAESLGVTVGDLVEDETAERSGWC